MHISCGDYDLDHMGNKGTNAPSVLTGRKCQADLFTIIEEVLRQEALT